MKDDIKLVRDIARRTGLSKDQQKLLHQELRHTPNLKYAEIMEKAKQIRIDFPNK